MRNGNGSYQNAMTRDPSYLVGGAGRGREKSRDGLDRQAAERPAHAVNFFRLAAFFAGFALGPPTETGAC